MIANILEYLDYIFKLALPKKLLYIAIDGVAPRAKLNQQRSRRYEAARARRRVLEEDEDVLETDETALEQEMQAIRDSLNMGVFDSIPTNTDTYVPVHRKQEDEPVASTPYPKSDASSTSSIADVFAFAKGEDFDDLASIPSTTQWREDQDPLGWDRNAITPGTPFMEKLGDRLRIFVQEKIAADDKWKHVAVILSDSKVHGEGEHKMVDFIRAQRQQPGYNPDTSHLLCGLDADLIMLGLSLHEPHCYIMRERREVGTRATSFKDLRFDVFSIDALRQYLQLEFRSKFRRDPSGKDAEIEMDIERIIDDFIFLCCFVGNDFLPNLPSCYVDANAIDNLLEIYRLALPLLGGYIVQDGQLDLHRVQYIIWQYSKLEDAQFIAEVEIQRETGRMAKPDVDLSDDHTIWRNIYYESIGVTSEKERTRMCLEYVRGLSWVLQYYFTDNSPNVPGSCGWSWFYPFHYAPFAHDIALFLRDATPELLGEIEGFKTIPTKPFPPMCQLLAVLPPDSHALLPPSYQELMLSTDSGIADFYPASYEIDRNGHQEEWKAVVRLPFVDERRLLSAASKCSLSAADTKRNTSQSQSLFFLHAQNPQAEDIAISQDGTVRNADFIAGQFLATEVASHKRGRTAVTDVRAWLFLDPTLSEGFCNHQLIQNVTLPQSIFQRPRRSMVINKLELSDYGTFFTGLVGVIYVVVILVEFSRNYQFVGLSDSLAWGFQATLLVSFHLSFGLLFTASHAFAVPAPPIAKRSAKQRFLRDTPIGTYRDWVCNQCCRRNFQKNTVCFKCSAPKSADALSLFSPRKPAFNAPRIVIDHRPETRTVKGFALLAGGTALGDEGGLYS
eukprot:TRINITY_DN2433_c0_g1_i2.p1 TRINITY_DN2433_c0_g1~~TRINITY_DN2433_c0_g1_i2.p1  ORF type:complete len:843 (+),score=113.95 TRINITY_DN2433_c0_g1_i2:187-2715(+)